MLSSSFLQPSPLFQKIEASIADKFRAKYGGNRQKEKAANNNTKTSATAGGDKADTDVETLLAEVTKQVRECCVEIRYPRSQTHNKRTCITKTSRFQFGEIFATIYRFAHKITNDHTKQATEQKEKNLQFIFVDSEGTT